MSKEKEILDLIRQNPMISQEEIAEKLNTTRSTVGVQIFNLQKKGYIVGRGYILNEDKYILGVGSSNIDIYGKSFTPIKDKYDHPSNITTNVGGVTHNILENISHLGGNIRFITAVGDDLYGKVILDECQKAGININDALIVENCSSGVFMQVLDDQNDMHLAMTDLSAIQQLNTTFLTQKAKIIKGARMIVCDPAMPSQSLDMITDFGVPVCIDPTSEALASKLKDIIGKFYFIKPNLAELKVIADVEINNDEDVEIACKSLLDKGLEKICVSLGSKGCLYMDNTGKVIRKAIEKNNKMVNASGAGDAFMGAFVYGFVNELDEETIVDYALAAGYAATMCDSTINPDLSVELIEEILKEKRK